MTDKPIKQVETIIISSILLIEILFVFLYLRYENRFFYHVFAVFLLIFYQLLVRIVTPRLLMLVHGKKRFNSDNVWFRQKPVENIIYRFFQVKKWKDRLPTIQPEAFSPKTNSLEGIIEMMCIAEVLHIQLFFWSLIFILFGFVFGHFWILILIAILSACWEFRFIMAQRYNRPRVKELQKKRK